MSSRLHAPRRCHFCAAILDAGAEVQWYRKSGLRAARSRHIAERSVPCCAGAYPGECEANRRAAEHAKHKAETASLGAAIADLLRRGDTAGALAAIAEAREGGS